MRKIAAVLVAIPFILYLSASSLVRRLTSGRGPAPVEPVQPDPRAMAVRVGPPEKLASPMVPVLPRSLPMAHPLATPRAVSAPIDLGPIDLASPRRKLPKAGTLQAGIVGGAVAVLVAALLIGLPAKQVAGDAPPTFAPLAPQASATRADNQPLDAPFQVQFTKPMNQVSVESAIAISPSIPVQYTWDVTAQVLSIVPNPHWQPNQRYSVKIPSAATDQEGLGLATEIDTSFDSGPATTGTIVATQKTGDQISPATTFQLTFTRPVKLATVILRFTITPTVPVAIVGDDPTDAASQVFTMTPKSQLASNTDYAISFVDGGTDSAGANLQTVASLATTTMTAPSVVRFRPQDGAISYDTNQVISVRFTVPMDEKTTAAAFSVTVNGAAVSGSLSWSEGDTVLALSPRTSFKIGSTVVARVSTAARAAGGLHVAGTATATFKVSRPVSVSIVWTGASGAGTAKWYGSEVYYLQLMNCTRTGGWVTSAGSCSTETHHTLPAQGNISLNSRISSLVSRPYAKYMADNRLLDHYLNGTNPHSRLCDWGGYCGSSWGENIASPSSAGQGGMIAIEIFYQNEYWCRCEHYYNIMDPYFHEAGIGVWYSNSVRVSIDFYS